MLRRKFYEKVIRYKNDKIQSLNPMIELFYVYTGQKSVVNNRCVKLTTVDP